MRLRHSFVFHITIPIIRVRQLINTKDAIRNTVQSQFVCYQDGTLIVNQNCKFAVFSINI